MRTPRSSFTAPGSKTGFTFRSLLVVFLLTLSPAKIRAAEDPPGCSFPNGEGNTSIGGINFNSAQNPAHVGDTVQIFPSLGMAANACKAVNVTGVVFIATGPVANFMLNQILTNGITVQCPGNAQCEPGPYQFTITTGLVGAAVPSPNGTAPGVPKTVRAVENGLGNVLTTTSEQLADFHTASLNIVTPCIKVFKQCNFAPTQTCFAAESPVRFSGYVTNCGDITLTNVVVVDNRVGQLTLLNPGSGLPVLPPFSLAAGAYAVFTNSFMPTLQETCAGSATNVVVATATDITTIGGPRASVTNSYTDVCPICVLPVVTVTKVCPSAPVQPGELLVYTGVVSNGGNITLTNVTVVDNQPTNNTPVLGPITLLPGDSLAFTNSYMVPLDSCGPYADTLTVLARTTCGLLVTNTASASCPGTNTPSIDVVKACPALPVPPGGLMVVTGTVTNTGNITLTNVVVTNNIGVLGISRRVLGPINLAPGAGTNFSDSYSVPVDSCGPYPDTFTAYGADKCFGNVVTDSDTKNCAGTNSPSIDVVKACPAQPVPPGGLMVVMGTVTNTGNITLTNVVVTNSISVLGITRKVLGPISLAPGTGTNFSDSYTVPLDSCGPYADTFTAYGADKCLGNLVTDSDTKNCAGTNTPRITIMKFCPPNPVAPDHITTISGVVSNAGNISLTNVVVFDDQPTNQALLVGPITLTPGQAVYFTNSYRLPRNCCTYIDTVSTSGRDKCLGRLVTASATAVCPTATNPKITVTKSCPPLPVSLGKPLLFSGTVSNAGNITLTNVIVVDNQPTNNTPVFGPVTLAPGEYADFTGSYIVPLNICETNILDTVTARGNNLCNGTNVSASQVALCPILPEPRLVVTKNCPVSPVPPGGLLAFSGIVSNAGNITLTNVIVVNDHPTNGTPVLGPITLAPQQFTNFSGSYRVCPQCCPPYVDTISGAGAQICNGSNVTASATAYCPGITTPKLSLLVDCPPNVVTQGEWFFYSGTVSNSGDVTVGDILVTDNKAGLLTDIAALAPAEAMDFFGFYIATNCGPSVPTVVTATAYNVCTGGSVSNQVTASCLIICIGGQPPLPPLLMNPTNGGGQTTFSLETETGKSYTAQYTDILVPANWQNFTNFTGSGGVITISNTTASQQRFYRVLVQ